MAARHSRKFSETSLYTHPRPPPPEQVFSTFPIVRAIFPVSKPPPFPLPATVRASWCLPASLKSNLASNRSRTSSAVKQEEEYDLLVIGGGATGSGIALDAATRGLKVAVVERDDFSAGTSSKSTKLVHGGVRYLEKAVWELDYNQ